MSNRGLEKFLICKIGMTKNCFDLLKIMLRKKPNLVQLILLEREKSQLYHNHL